MRVNTVEVGCKVCSLTRLAQLTTRRNVGGDERVARASGEDEVRE